MIEIYKILFFIVVAKKIINNSKVLINFILCILSFGYKNYKHKYIYVLYSLDSTYIYVKTYIIYWLYWAYNIKNVVDGLAGYRQNGYVLYNIY